MQYHHKAILIVGALVVLLSLAPAVRLETGELHEPMGRTYPEPATSTPQLTSLQRSWIGALEWCESSGNPDAVNPEDRDGTPSYGAFQFKPDTFYYYAEKYGIETPNLQEQIDATPVIDGAQGIRAASYDREYQLRVVEQMVLHRDEINWHQQFPACVRKLGLPPRP